MHLNISSQQREMEVKNVTENENQRVVEELFCSETVTGGVHGQLTFLSAFNIFLSIAAFLGNTLILVALHKETSTHPPSKLLYRNLAITDLCVGMIAEPLAVTYWTSAMNRQWNICYYAQKAGAISSYILCLVSLYTVTAISVDRLLALLLGLRYRQVVTLKRIRISLIVFWLLSLVSSLTFFRIQIMWWLPRVGGSLCLVTSIFSYIKIVFTLRHNQIHVQNHVSQGQPNQTIPLNRARYRRAVNSVLWVQVALVVCYLPSGITSALIMTQGGVPLTSYIARQFTSTLVFLNSSLNPLIYCWKIRKVREAVKETLRQFSC